MTTRTRKSKAIVIVLCLALILQLLLIFPSAADARKTVAEENFTSSDLNAVPTADGWSAVNTGADAAVTVQDAGSTPNRAMNIIHTEKSAKPINAAHHFTAADTLTVSFDYMYERMTMNTSGKGGAIASFMADGDTSIIAGVLITLTDISDDSYAKVQYRTNGKSFADAGYSTIEKGKWYHFELSVEMTAEGSFMGIKISRGETVLLEVTDRKNTLTTLPTMLNFANRSSDTDECHWIDNVELSAGEHSFSDDFEAAVVEAAPDEANWELWDYPANPVNSAKSYIKVRKMPIRQETTVQTASNQAMNIIHAEAKAKPINAAHHFTAANTLTLSFDYMYERMTLVTSGRGGAIISFMDDTQTIIAGVLITRIADDDDSSAKVQYRTGSGFKDVGYGEIEKSKWYHFDLSVEVTAEGAFMDVVISHDGTELFRGDGFKCTKTASPTTLNLANRSQDADECHWIDNIEMTAGEYAFSDDFQGVAAGEAPDNADWEIWDYPASPVDSTKSYIVVGTKGESDVTFCNKALLIRDDSTVLGPVSAVKSFEALGELTAEFAYLLATEENYAGNLFGVYGTASGAEQEKLLFGIFPNYEGDNYSGTSTLKYFDGNQFVATAKTDILPGEWYRIGVRIEEGGETAALTLDGAKLADIPADKDLAAVDHIVFRSMSAEGSGDAFFIDELTIQTHAHEYGAWIEEIPATTNTEGVRGHYTCAGCGKNFDADYQEIADLTIPCLPVRIEGIKQNIILTADFRTNIFIPRGEKQLSSVRFDGVELPMQERMLDGVSYDCVTIAIDAKDAAKSFDLTLTFTYEGNVHEQTLTIGIVRYAQLLKAFEEGRYASLADTILSYVKQAVGYAGGTAEFEAGRVPAEKAEPVNSFAAESPINGASVNVGEKPVIVFSLNETYSGKIRFSWTAGQTGKKVVKEVSAQSLVALEELSLCNLAETVTVEYLNGEGQFVLAGQYNLAAYAAYAQGTENQALIALIDVLYDYAIAAHRYQYGE